MTTLFPTLFVCLFIAPFSFAQDIQILDQAESAKIISTLITEAKSIQIQLGEFALTEDRVEVAASDFNLPNYLLSHLVFSNVLPPVGDYTIVAGVETVCSEVPLTCTLKIMNTMFIKQKDGFNQSIGSFVVKVDFNGINTDEGVKMADKKITLGTEFLAEDE